MRQHRRLEDDDDSPFDKRGALKDGRSIRTPMYFMDATQRGVREHFQQVTDGSSDGAGLHRPGPRYIADAAMRDAKQAAYDAYLHDVTNAWRGAPAREYPASAEGSTCTVRGYKYRDHFGAAGTVVNGECVPDELQRDALQARDSNMADVYAAYDARIREMWRNP